MNQPIQRTYSRYYQPGQVGQNARPSAPYDIDLGAAGETLLPGDGVYADPGTGKFIKPVDTDTRKLVTHVVNFGIGSQNFAIPSPTTNNNTRVEFLIGTIVPLIAFGSVFVMAGETVKSGDAAIYNETTERWIKYLPANATTNDLRKKAFAFYLNPGTTVDAGQIVEIRIPGLTYAFPAIETIDSVTAKIIIPATDIKTLRASAYVLIPAGGAGTMLQFVSVALVLTAGTEVLTESDDNLEIIFGGGEISGLSVSNTIETTGFIDQAADTVTNAIPVGDGIDALEDVENESLALKNIGDGEFAGNATDDAVLTVYITYRTITL